MEDNNKVEYEAGGKKFSLDVDSWKKQQEFEESKHKEVIDYNPLGDHPSRLQEFGKVISDLEDQPKKDKRVLLIGEPPAGSAMVRALLEQASEKGIVIMPTDSVEISEVKQIVQELCWVGPDYRELTAEECALITKGKKILKTNGKSEKVYIDNPFQESYSGFQKKYRHKPTNITPKKKKRR